MSGGGRVIDLDRERRIRRHLAKLRGLLDADPGLEARTRAMLAGDVPCPDLEGPMAHDAVVNLRLPRALLDRAEALVPALEADVKLQASRVTRAVVIRLALAKGLEALEEEYRTGEDG